MSPRFLNCLIALVLIALSPSFAGDEIPSSSEVRSFCEKSALIAARLAERDHAVRSSEVERIWWAPRRVYLTDLDIAQDVALGQLVILSRMNNGYRISSNVKNSVATPEMRLFLADLVRQWRVQLIRSDLDPLRHDLIVASLIRTQTHQNELIAQGAPAADVSSHSKGVAVDIGKIWFERNDRGYADALYSVLQSMADKGQINLIAEDLAGVWHIALSPDFERELRQRLNLR